MIDITRKEGFAANFRGSSARVLWLVPFTAIYFGVHEKSKRMLLKRCGSTVFSRNDITCFSKLRVLFLLAVLSLVSNIGKGT
mmetsp:Transcript_7810/g.34790  ORF Transcript_7810/g.34790 Transcript_7810/m.34790 type:complete len:82 (+) Transcript_7810:129-374(+)